jgi:hypothetical protein
MDPLESVARYRKTQTGAGGRTLTVAPPPPMPVAPSGATGPGVDVVDLDDTGELDLSTLQEQVGVDGPADTEATGERKLRGNTRGRKQLLYVYLPGPTIERLDAARPAHGTLGQAVMAALRGSYEWLVAHHTPQPVQAVGPFPAVHGPKRRQGVEEGRLKPFYVDPEEAKGIDTLAEQLEMSASELVTLALDHWYGEERD